MKISNNQIRTAISDPARYSGRIYKGDFHSYHSMADIAERIISDMRFDDECKKNIKNRMEGGASNAR